MKTVGRVMPELINWLHDKDYSGDEEYNKKIPILMHNNIIEVKEFKRQHEKIRVEKRTAW